jgi:ATP-dependent protease ClpP protease subunit
MAMIEITPIAEELCKEMSPLPSSDEVSLWALEKDRKIYIDYDIDDTLSQAHRLIMRWNIEDKGLPIGERKPIWIYVMSYGGDLDYMWMLIDVIMLSSTPIYTVNINEAGSAAGLIFLAGHRRYMMPRSKLVIHEGSAQLSGDAVKVMDQSESYKKQLKQMKDFILERTTIPKQQLMRKRNNDWELDATYCLEHNACDKIVTDIEEII